MLFPARAFPYRTLCTAALVLLLLAGCSKAPHTAKAADVRPAKDRKVAPDFALKDAKGATVRLSDYKGKVVLLDFWATWCGPCKIEIPWFMEFQQQFKDRGFTVLGVSMDEGGWDDVKPYIEQRKINYPILLGDDVVDKAYGGLDSLPTTLLIDRTGKIAAVHVGVDKGKDEIRDEIDHLLMADTSAATGALGAAAPAIVARAK
jgi:cytochrome c biogenesis protein CcmG/thiol:disulfide interchange protein DsbE